MCSAVGTPYTYLNPGEMPEAREGERDGGVHVRAGDVAGGVDHDGDDEAAGHGLPQLGDALEVLAVDGRRAAGHEHQQERRHHFGDHLRTSTPIISDLIDQPVRVATAGRVAVLDRSLQPTDASGGGRSSS